VTVHTSHYTLQDGIIHVSSAVHAPQVDRFLQSQSPLAAIQFLLCPLDMGLLLLDGLLTKHLTCLYVTMLFGELLEVDLMDVIPVDLLL